MLLICIYTAYYIIFYLTWILSRTLKSKNECSFLPAVLCASSLFCDFLPHNPVAVLVFISIYDFLKSFRIWHFACPLPEWFALLSHQHISKWPWLFGLKLWNLDFHSNFLYPAFGSSFTVCHLILHFKIHKKGYGKYFILFIMLMS